jgi:hypothetical protein
MPIPRPRLPIQRIDVPVNESETVAPATFVCIADPPLHPRLVSLFTHAPASVTAESPSSTRAPGPGDVGGGGGGGGGWVVVVPPPPTELSPPPPPPHETRSTASSERKARTTNERVM